MALNYVFVLILAIYTTWFEENLSGFFPLVLPVVKNFPWVGYGLRTGYVQ
jgi:hypothetical protein